MKLETENGVEKHLPVVTTIGGEVKDVTDKNTVMRVLTLGMALQQRRTTLTKTKKSKIRWGC